MSYFGTGNKPKDIPAEIERVVDAVSEASGFANREPLKAPPKRKRGTTDQLHNFTMRLSIRDAERFIKWCDRERLSYREAFARLVAHLDP